MILVETVFHLTLIHRQVNRKLMGAADYRLFSIAIVRVLMGHKDHK